MPNFIFFFKNFMTFVSFFFFFTKTLLLENIIFFFWSKWNVNRFLIALFNLKIIIIIFIIMAEEPLEGSYTIKYVCKYILKGLHLPPFTWSFEIRANNMASNHALILPI